MIIYFFVLYQDNLLFALMQKVTKKSRQTRMLRRFAGPPHNNHKVLVTSIHLFTVFLSNAYFTPLPKELIVSAER
jgi:hypothetical protein